MENKCMVELTKMFKSLMTLIMKLKEMILLLKKILTK
jgi:hypothetical protein